jgi:hypothetical protein
MVRYANADSRAFKFKEEGMNRAALILLMLLPVAVVAQDRDVSFTNDQPGAVDLLQPEASTTGNDLGASNGLGSVKSAEFAFDQATGSNSQRIRPHPSNKASEETKRPKTAGSMVGYVEDGIVGSQVRIRFDAGFNNTTPDLAEFFYAKCGCYRGLANVAPAAFDPNSPGPPPGTNIVIPKALNFQQLYLDAEYAPHSHFSAFVEVPFRWIQAQGLTAGSPGSFPNQAGISDVRAGFKAALLASYDHYLTVQFRIYFPSGDALKGLGTNHWSIEPTVLYFQRLSDRAAIESQIGDWHPIGGSAGVPTSGSSKFSGDVFYYGVGPSYEVYRGENVRFAPVVELVGWHILGGFETGTPSDATGLNIVNLKIGARTSVGNHSSFYAGYGHALTNHDWYDNIVRFEYRYSF